MISLVLQWGGVPPHSQLKIIEKHTLKHRYQGMVNIAAFLRVFWRVGLKIEIHEIGNPPKFTKSSVY